MVKLISADTAGAPDLPDRSQILVELTEFAAYVLGFKSLSTISLKGAEALYAVLEEAKNRPAQGSETAQPGSNEPNKPGAAAVRSAS
jgi:hypothetical protein